jgi:DGQHR domain-containing protein
LTAEELLRVADIPRLGRTDNGELAGYQRQAVSRHIRNIAAYLEGDDIIFPSSLILAISSKTRFTTKGRRPRQSDEFVTAGTITLLVPRNGGPKPAWIVDGQQRALALARSQRRDFPVAVNAFVAENVNLQREQFLRVNSTRPLPRGLTTELLPELTGDLPAHLAERRAPSLFCDLLNRDSESPFSGLMRRASTPPGARRTAVVADTAIIRVLQESLATPAGCLFPYRNISSGEVDVKGVRAVLLVYWNAVKDTFPEAWGLPPGQSRLMHSAGLRAMGRLMDRMMKLGGTAAGDSPVAVRRELERLRPFCRWTGGTWEELGGLRWNELQNVPAHTRMLSEFLIRCYHGATAPA